MQLRAQEKEASDDVDVNDFDDCSTIVNYDSLDDFNDDAVDFSADVEKVINNPIELVLDFYSREGLDACRDNAYLDTSPSSLSSRSIPDDVYSFGLSLSDLQTQTKLHSYAAAAAQSHRQISTIDDTTEECPPVFLTNGTHDEPAIMDIIHKFTLNKAQQRAFRIIASHSLGRSKIDPQLRMGVFGERGTGKSKTGGTDALRTKFLSKQDVEGIVGEGGGTVPANKNSNLRLALNSLPLSNQMPIPSLTRVYTVTGSSRPLTNPILPLR